MIIALIFFECFHYIVGAMVFMAVDVSPRNVSGIKIWKILVIGGVGMILHWCICILSDKLSIAECNWSLKEWIRK